MILQFLYFSWIPLTLVNYGQWLLINFIQTFCGASTFLFAVMTVKMQVILFRLSGKVYGGPINSIIDSHEEEEKDKSRNKQQIIPL